MEFHLPEYFLGDLAATLAFGILAILLIILGYVTFDKLTPKLDFNDLLNKGNVSMAVVIGSLFWVCVMWSEGWFRRFWEADFLVLVFLLEKAREDRDRGRERTDYGHITKRQNHLGNAYGAAA